MAAFRNIVMRLLRFGTPNMGMSYIHVARSMTAFGSIARTRFSISNFSSA